MHIPEGYRVGVSKILRLDDRSVREIRNALDQAAYTCHRPDDVAVEAISSISHANLDEFKEIAEAVGTLYSVKVSRRISLEQFVEDVCDAMEAVDSPDLKLQAADRPQFKEKLLTVFGSANFEIVAKAFDLKTDDERVFCGARLLTDLRPIFGQNVEDGPKAMVVVHLLKLGFDRVGDPKRHNEFHVSLDAEDLGALRELIKRAEDKASTLRSSVKDIPVFGAPKE
jgi:hypothetical protein